MRESYSGRVSIDIATFQQTATAEVHLQLTFDDDGTGRPTSVVSHATLDMYTTDQTYEVTITSSCSEGESSLGTRTWTQSFPRDLG
jgi:hypothetical protein